MRCNYRLGQSNQLMDFPLLFLGLILLGHHLIFFLGIIRMKKLTGVLNILQGIVPSIVVVLALFFQSWELMITAFLLERIWIILELSIKSIAIKRPLEPFFFLQILGFIAGLVVAIAHLGWAFIWVYGVFWLASFLYWKSKVQHIPH